MASLTGLQQGKQSESAGCFSLLLKLGVGNDWKVEPLKVAHESFQSLTYASGRGHPGGHGKQFHESRS
jgi:hypothetical protein